MASYRFFDLAPVFWDLLGIKPCAGGSLAFYDIGTTTPKNTWSDRDLTILNTNPVILDSSGRANVNIWLDGAYSVTLRDAANVVVWTRDIDSGADGGLVIPPLEAGKWLTNDGSNPLWGTFFQLPDPTGSDNKMVVASGGGYVLQAQPTIPALPIVTTDTSIKVNNMLDQWGTGSIPATGGAAVSSVTITFPTAYIATPNCSVNINRSSGVVAAGFIGCLGYTASPTQLTVFFDLNITETGSPYNLVSPVPITWRAVGKVAS